MFDSHIHLNQYSDKEIEEIVSQVDGIIAVATDLTSSKKLLELQAHYSSVHIAAGFHPEQPLPGEDELNEFRQWIKEHHHELIGIGEVGLPHYLNREGKVKDIMAYILVLDQFIELAAELKLPIILHAVYDDALIVLNLLKKHDIKKAHFHWFKASDDIIRQIVDAGFMVSVTPDVVWNKKTRRVIELIPIHQLMIETDGPWPHVGFTSTEIGRSLSAIIDVIADIKGTEKEIVIQQINSNTITFYSLKEESYES